MNTKLTKLMRIGLWIMIIGFFFALTQSIYFLILYGWHWGILTRAEHTADYSTALIMFIGYGMYVYELHKQKNS